MAGLAAPDDDAELDALLLQGIAEAARQNALLVTYANGLRDGAPFERLRLQTYEALALQQVMLRALDNAAQRVIARKARK